MKRLLTIALFVAVLIVGWIFAARNDARISVDWVGGEVVNVPLWLALVASFVAGAALAGLVGLYRATRISLEARRYRREVASLEAEVHQLRNLPLAEKPPPDARERGEPEAVERGSL